MKPTNHSMRVLSVLRVLGATLLATALPAAATQWDMSAGDFHTHLVSTERGFQLHIHDKATHKVVDTRRGRVVATMLSGTRTQPVALTFLQAGVLTAAQPLAGDWTLLVRFDVPGMKPAQVRYSSKMKPGKQDIDPAGAKSKPATKSTAKSGDASHEHDHEHDHDGDHDHASGK